MFSGYCRTCHLTELLPRSCFVEASLSGFIAQFKVRQVFKYEGEDASDLTYLFPDNRKLCLCDMTFEIAGEIIKPHIEGTEEAQEQVQEAQEAGHTTIMSHASRKGFIDISLGNICDGDEIIVSVTLVTFVSASGSNDIFVKFPLYSCQYDAERGTTLWGSSSDLFSFELDCSNAGYEIANVSGNAPSDVYDSASKKFSVKNIDNRDAIVISFTLSEPIHNDFFVTGQYLVLSFFGKDVATLASRETQNREFVFVVDCSGSMAGGRIKRARECMDVFLRSLPVGSYFNIIRFGSRFTSLFNKSAEYSRWNFRKAIRYASNLEADLGGTVLRQPLQSIFNQKPVGGGDRQVFIMTDGEVFDASEVFKLCEEHKDHNRIFTLGIGSGADAGIVEGLADLTGGRSDFVWDSRDFSSKVIPQLEASLQCPITNLSIQIEGHDAIETSLVPLPNATIDGLMHVVVKSEKAFSGDETVLVSGLHGGESVDVPITANHPPKDDAEFSRLADVLFHFQKIRSLEKLYGKLSREEESKSECKAVGDKIVALSKSSGILSELTAFVGFTAMTREGDFVNVSRRQAYDPTPFNGFGWSVVDSGYLPMVVEDAIDGEVRKKSGCMGGGGGGDRVRRFEAESLAMCEEIEPPRAKKESARPRGPSEFTYLAVTSLQDLVGYWEDVSSLFKGVGAVPDMPEVLRNLSGVSGSVKANAFNTVVAIAILRYQFMPDHASWHLIERKGLSWLSSVSKDIDWERLIQEVLSGLAGLKFVH